MNARPVERATARTLTIDGVERVAFSGTDYLGLSFHPEVLAAAKEGFDRYGLSASASRATSGNFVEHEALEVELAEFLETEASLVTTDGWLADEVLLAGLRTRVDELAIDSEAHAALRAAASIAELSTREFGPSVKRTAWLTDGVFPMQQRVADVAALSSQLCEADYLIVDDSHGVGWMGREGRGTVHASGVRDPRVVVTGSLAKTLGASGGFLAGSKELLDEVRESAPAYVGTTPIPPAIAAAARASVRIVREEPVRVARLHENAKRLRDLGQQLGLRVSEIPLPVLAVPDSEREIETRISEAGLFIPWTSYGTGSGHLRIAVNSEHTSEDLERLEAALLPT